MERWIEKIERIERWIYNRDYREMIERIEIIERWIESCE